MDGNEWGEMWSLFSTLVTGEPKAFEAARATEKLTHHAKHKTGHNMPSIRCNKQTNTYIMCISLSTTREHKAQA